MIAVVGLLALWLTAATDRFLMPMSKARMRLLIVSASDYLY